MRNLMVVTSAAALVAAIGSGPADAGATHEGKYVYAVKYICGSVLPRVGADIPDAYYEAVVPGWYSTVINHHNPNEKTIAMEYEANTTHGEPNATYAPPTGSEDQWHSNVAFEIDCRDLYNPDHYDHASPDRFVKGIYYIYSTYPIDVIAVYTAAPWVLGTDGTAGGWTPGVSSLQVLPIAGRLIGGKNGYVREERY
jgi:hypothetical protein